MTHDEIGVMRGGTLSVYVPESVVPEDNSFKTVSSRSDKDDVAVTLESGFTRLRVGSHEAVFDDFRYFPTDYEGEPRGPGGAKVDLRPTHGGFWPDRVSDRHDVRNMTVKKLIDGLRSGRIEVLPKE